MTRCCGAAVVLLGTVVAAGAGCRVSVSPPDVRPARIIEPAMVETPPGAKAAGSAPIRLLDTQAQANIGRRLVHKQAGGELVEDPVWMWSSAPDRYLDLALRLALSSSPDLHLVDTGRAPALAVTLIAWYVEAANGGRRLVGAAEVTVVRTDRAVRAEIVRASEPVAAELPGDLAGAAGRLLHKLASGSIDKARQSTR
jgi:hypothetical protein